MKPPPSILAIVLLVLLSLFNLIPIPVGPDGVPVFVARLALLLGGLGLIAAVGLWFRQPWAKWLAGMVLLGNALSAAPGLAFAPNTTLRTLATLTVVVSVLTFWLLLRKPARQSLT